MRGAASTIVDSLLCSMIKVVNYDGKCPSVLRGYKPSAPLTPSVKPWGGVDPIVVGMLWRRLVSKVTTIYSC